MNTDIVIQLKNSIKNATKSTFYRNKLRDYTELNSLEDFYKLPLTSTKELIENNNSFLTCSQREIEKIVTINTSGTTKRTKRIFFSKEELNSTVMFFMQGLSTIINTGDYTLVMMPCKPQNSVGDLICKAVNNIGATPFDVGFLKDFDETVELLKKSNSIVGTPMQILALARYCTFKNIKIKLRGILLSADYGSEAVYDEIAKVFDCLVIDHYGTTEMCFGGAVECSSNKGMHIREKDLFFEIVDKDSKQPLKIGEYGEIVVTTLTRTLMPLIRYQTGDYGRILPFSCDCNNKGLMLDKIQGRIENIFLDNSMVNCYRLDEYLFSIKMVIDYKMIINDNDVKIDIYSLSDDIDKEQIKNELQHNFFNCCSVSLNIIVTQVWPNLYYGKRVVYG